MREIESIYAKNRGLGRMRKKARQKFMPLVDGLMSERDGDIRLVAHDLNCRRFRQETGCRWCRRSLSKFLIRWNS